MHALECERASICGLCHLHTRYERAYTSPTVDQYRASVVGSHSISIKPPSMDSHFRHILLSRSHQGNPRKSSETRTQYIQWFPSSHLGYYVLWYRPCITVPILLLPCCRHLYRVSHPDPLRFSRSTHRRQTLLASGSIMFSSVYRWVIHPGWRHWVGLACFLALL
jgi:hypothetical protein